MEKYSAEWIKEQVGTRTRLPLRNCTLCNTELYYLVKEDRIFFDGNCDCVSYTTQLIESSWDKLAATFALQSSDEIRDKLMERLLSYEPA